MNVPHDRSGLILASKSPRRSELLEQAGLIFSVIPSDVDESTVAVSNPDSYVISLAESKALDISQKHPAAWVIGADTVVVIDGKILGKPASERQAVGMLSQLSGQTHEVLTGFCLLHRSKAVTISRAVRTLVRFKRLNPAEIDWYVATGEPFDKAGAYAIQEHGDRFVERIEGSWSNVVGLPMELVQRLLDGQEL